MEALLLIFSLIIIIHAIDTLSYSVRIAAVRTGRLALSMSLFNILVLFARTANMVQAPLVGAMVDEGINSGTVELLTSYFRLIILSATVGSVLGAFLIPTFVVLFEKAIRKMETEGSLSKVLINTMRVQSIKVIGQSLRTPKLTLLHKGRPAGLPKTFLLLNIIITAIYTIGVLSSIYAGVLFPPFRLTSSQLSGIINGVATILLVVLVDPKAALITDQAMQGMRKQGDVTTMVKLLVGGKIIGTLVGQIIFLPAAYVVLLITRMLIEL